MGDRRKEKDLGGDRQNNQLGGRADPVDGEAAQPFLEVVALGAEDEVNVAFEGEG